MNENNVTRDPKVEGNPAAVPPWNVLRSLTRTRKDNGALYTRETDVIGQIKRFCEYSEKRRREALNATYAGNDTDRPREETLVYFIREYQRRGNAAAAWELLETLTDRIAGHVARKLARWRLPQHEQEDCMGDLTAAVCESVLSFAPSEEFWEVRFWVCMDRRLYALIEKRQAVRDAEVRPSDDFGTEEESASGGEGVFARLTDTGANPEVVALRKGAIAQLTEVERQAVYLKYVEGLPEESDDPAKQTIAKILGVTGRSVRNYLRKAERKLHEWTYGEA